MWLRKSWQGLRTHAEDLGLCPENRKEPLRGFMKQDMTRIASCKDDSGCSSRMLSLPVEEWVWVADPALHGAQGTVEAAQGGGGRVGEERTGSRWRAAGKGMEVLCPALGTDLGHLFEVGGSLKAGLITMNSVLDLLLVALTAQTRRVLVSDVAIPFLPPKYCSSLGGLTPLHQSEQFSAVGDRVRHDEDIFRFQ